MGTYSWFVSTRNNAAGCAINWDAMNTDVLFKCYPLKRCYKTTSNLQEVAEMLDESKFIGYMTDEFIAALYEFCRNLVPYDCFPRIYYTWEGDDNLWCFEFVPGTTAITIFTFNCARILSNSVNKQELATDGVLAKLITSGDWNMHRVVYS
jgi:hypothetical protein